MKWQDIVDISPEEFMQLSKEELKARVQILASAGNKRLKRAQEKGFSSPSIEAVLKKGKFSTKDKSFAQLRNEFIRAKQFLQSKTGTLGEFNKFKRHALAQLTKESGIKITPEQFDTFWRAYEEFMHQNSIYFNQSLRIQQFLGQETFWKTRDFTQGDFNSLLVKLNTEETGPNWWADMEDYL